MQFFWLLTNILSTVSAVHVERCVDTVEKEQQDYQRNRRLSAIDLSRGALKPGGLKEKV